MATRRWVPLLALAFTSTRVDSGEADQVERIVARHLKAMGGVERLSALRSFRQSGRLIMSDGSRSRGGTFLVEAKRPCYFRYETAVDGRRGVVAFDGTRAWRQAQGEAAEALTGDDAASVEDSARFDSWLIGYQREGTRVTLVDRFQLGSRDVVRLLVVPRGFQERWLWLDADSFRPLRYETRKGSLSSFVAFERYRQVDGLASPSLYVMTSDRNPWRTVLFVERNELDVVIPDQRFQMPTAR
jgi:hypothetical protein